MRAALSKLQARGRTLSVDSNDQLCNSKPGPENEVWKSPAGDDTQLPRKTSERLGNRFLHRAKSIIGRQQQKPKDRGTTKPEPMSPSAVRANSVDGECPELDLATSEALLEMPQLQSTKHPQTSGSYLEGWLYRRKRLKWRKSWAVLHTNKVLAFYKDDQQGPLADPQFVMDLQKGCDFGSIAQDKSGNVFVLSRNADSSSDETPSSSSGKGDDGRDSLQLMCKSLHEFVYWMKAFVMVNTSAILPERDQRGRDTIPLLHGASHNQQGSKQIRPAMAQGKDTRINLQPSQVAIPRSSLANPFRREPSEAVNAGVSTYSPGLDVLEGFNALEVANLSNRSLQKQNAVDESPALKLDTNANHLGAGNDHCQGANNKLDCSAIPDSLGKLGKAREQADGRNSDALRSRGKAESKVMTRSPVVDDSGNLSPTEAAGPKTNTNRTETKARRGETCVSSNIAFRSADDAATRTFQSGPTQDDAAAWAEKYRGDEMKRRLNSNPGSEACRRIDEKSDKVRNDRAPNLSCNDARALGGFIAAASGRSIIAGVVGESDSGGIGQTRGPCGRSSVAKRDLPPLEPFSSRCLVHKEPPDGSPALLAASEAVVQQQSLQESRDSKRGYLEYSLENSEPDFYSAKLFAKTSVRRRRYSEGEVLEACNSKTYRMRFTRKPVPELTKIDFIEIYGGLDGKGISDSDINTHADFNMPFLTMKRRGGVNKTSSLGNDDQSSSEESSSGASFNSESAEQATGKLQRVPSRISSGSGSSDGSTKVGSRSGRFSNLASAFRLGGKNADSNSPVKATVLQLPASQLANASHRGYLDRRNKKKQWERFWCVLLDSCLYCYNSPQSASTRDVILLRGYDVMANVTNVNRTRFMFRLEQESAPTLHFSADNHPDYLLWVGTLERDTRSVTTSDGSRKESNTRKENLSPAHSLSGASLRSVESTEEPCAQKNDASDLEHIDVQKHKLLKEIVNQQQQILLDQQQLSRKTSVDSTTPVHHRRGVVRRDHVIDKYERERDEEELKTTKFMTHLTRRRNSAQLKVDQLSRDLAPRTGRKRSKDPKQFAAVEAKLEEMRAKLARIDEEIVEQQAKKQNVIIKLQERQDFELLLAEQQETLEIMRRHEHDAHALAPVRRYHQVSRNRSPLESIEDLSSISDCSSTASSERISDSKGVMRTMSTPRQPRSDKQSGFDSNLSTDSIPSTREESGRKTMRQSKSLEQPRSVLYSRSAASLDERGGAAPSSLSHSTSSLPVVKSADETSSVSVDPAVLAEIEMFEQFSAITLEKIRSKSPSSNSR